eukprot:10126445-Alexandrium_andersonii.AAC.1
MNMYSTRILRGSKHTHTYTRCQDLYTRTWHGTCVLLKTTALSTRTHAHPCAIGNGTYTRVRAPREPCSTTAAPCLAWPCNARCCSERAEGHDDIRLT